MPAGASFSTMDTPVKPGSSDGLNAVAYAEVSLGKKLPVGIYTARLAVSDGTTVDGVPITIDVQTSCGY
jgi:hypothetical protein